MPNLRARELRWNMTEAETKLWWLLRRKQLMNFRFRRQHPIGPYVVDFFCPGAKLVVELDGSQHATEKNEKKDALRTKWLESHGYRVLRIWNRDIFVHTESVMDTIYAAFHPPSGASRHLPPQGGKVKPD